MTRTMYDAVTSSNIPAGATMVAGYADGLYANVPAMRARFPHATVVTIAVRWTTKAQVLDVETGDATPAQAVQWCTRTMAATPNGQLTVYCNSSTWPSVRAAFRAAGVTEPNYWIAQYDGDPTIPAGAVAKQYRDPGPYDLSSVADYWPGVDPLPEDDMTPAQAQQLATVAAEVAALKAALVDPTIKSLIDGAPHTLGDHTAATNDWAFVTKNTITALKAQADTLAVEVAALKTSAATAAADVAALKTGLAAAVTTLQAIAAKVGA
jgi:hypothetical protein